MAFCLVSLNYFGHFTKGFTARTKELYRGKDEEFQNYYVVYINDQTNYSKKELEVFKTLLMTIKDDLKYISIAQY